MENKIRRTQTSDILAYMQAGNFITDELARELFGAHRLSAIIFNLRKTHIIRTVMVEGKNRYGTISRYAKYYLADIKEGSDA